MGAGNSNNAKIAAQYGGIYLRPDKDRYYPGEQFTGTIYINLIKDYPGDSLYIQFKGTEKWMHAYITRDNDNHTHHHFHKGRTPILDIRLLVIKNNGVPLANGQYAYPVSFLIPQNIPGSIYHEGNGYVASIEFKVKALLDTFDPKGAKLKYKEIIVIDTPRTSQGVPLQKLETIPLQMCCCKYGTATISLALQKDALMPGETTKIKFSVDNSQGNLAFLSVRCELLEQVIIGNVHRTFQYLPAFISFPGFAEKAPLRENEADLTIPNYNPLTLKSKKIHYKRYGFHDVHAMRQRFGTVDPTTFGKIVNVKHFLAVELVYNGSCFCCLRPPRILIPVQIYSPQFTLPPMYQAPQDWHPKMMPTTNLTLDAQIYGEAPKQNTQLISAMNTNFMKPQQDFTGNVYGGGDVELQKPQ